MTNEMNKHKYGGFSYTVTEEQIREHLKLSPAERLRWLEEAQEFMFKALTPEQWEILQKFRRGEV